MKTCPTCKARCFDDMEICYGCMHRFGEGDRGPDLGDTQAFPAVTPSPVSFRASGRRRTAKVPSQVEAGSAPVKRGEGPSVRKAPPQGRPRVFGAVEGMPEADLADRRDSADAAPEALRESQMGTSAGETAGSAFPESGKMEPPAGHGDGGTMQTLGPGMPGQVEILLGDDYRLVLRVEEVPS